MPMATPKPPTPPPRAPTLPNRWAVRVDPAGDGVANMAADAALLAWARETGSGVVRVYGWSRPTVSFGRNEAVAGRFTPASLAAAGVAAVRRPTGGRALLHHREVTYAVALPLPAALGWRGAYAAINARLLAALQGVGIPARLAPDAPGVGAPVRPAGPVCFDAPAPGEVMVAGRKLVGSAVWREGDGYLQHGSILWHDDQALLAAAAAVPLPPPAPAATLAAHAPALTAAALADALVAALTAPAPGAPAPTVAPFPDSAAVRAAQAALHTQYADDAWLWRR